MKKRLTSILLVAVMLLATIPVLSIEIVAASDPTSYKTTVSAENIELDGVLDDAYKYSQKI